ncbi:hypothetical protein [Mesorhizobium sp. BR1-1-14]|uniref:hypothetical protein n=1 Tax=Mesorhizobium sp. BR1-1-14 TaxID=2876655 RepID=UPI001CD13D8C|nr:hypothetical protein [Mesorhizobium sp. BR1-1-14]MBZ9960617.1 hypothetical protein [Mesorhizobium sp. BR1-1-14]
MRIVKLSTAEFPDLGKVREFFQSKLEARAPQGKFRVTAARISRQKGLDPDDYLVFTYKGRVVFTARSGSRLLPNPDGIRETHPYYFIVALGTLRESDVSVEELERRYNLGEERSVNVASSQGWNRLPASPRVDKLWGWLTA